MSLERKQHNFLSPHDIPFSNNFLSLGDFVANNKEKIINMPTSLSAPDISKLQLDSEGLDDNDYDDIRSHQRYSVLIHLDRYDYLRRLNISWSEVRSKCSSLL